MDSVATIWVFIYNQNFGLQHWAIYITTDSDFDDEAPPVDDDDADEYSDRCGTLYHIVGEPMCFENLPFYSYPLSTRTNISSKTQVGTIRTIQNLGRSQQFLETWQPNNDDYEYNCQEWVMETLERLRRNRWMVADFEGMAWVGSQRGIFQGREGVNGRRNRRRRIRSRRYVDECMGNE